MKNGQRTHGEHPGLIATFDGFREEARFQRVAAFYNLPIAAMLRMLVKRDDDTRKETP